ncbi:YlqD family protein [Ammonifex thiophilus]|uniref:YlqD family protein n=1 Tax=Ammonifex thiophilus TaxID=444093 RepID=UPI001F0C419C|nr:YlqD family protein [Ammonifex thiophilus]
MRLVEKIVVTRPVVIKVKLTPRYREILLARLGHALELAERELKRVEAELGQLQGKSQAEALEHLRREKVAARDRLRQQYESVKNLPLGTELVQGRTESLVEVGVGDEASRLGPVEIVIEEGKIVAVREQGL